MHTTSQLAVRDPDGVPHEIVGLTWLVALAVAIGSFVALTFGGVVSALVLLFVPGVVISLDQRARRQRDANRRATKRLR
jgi:hypothetical protein